ncbi:MAG: peptidylprolyl isomerase [Waterburya sp.]
MTAVIQTGDQIITAEELIPLLHSYQMLPRLVTEYLIDKAIKPIKCTPEEITAACKKFALANQLTTETEKLAWLERYQLDSEQFIAIATRDLKIAKFKQVTWGEQVKHYFFHHKQQFDRVIYSIIWVEDRDLAQEIYFRLEEKEQSFTQLAQQYSQVTEAPTGRTVGPVEFKALPQPFKKAFAINHEEGKTLPMRLGKWMAVVRLEKYLNAQLDQPTQQRILNELFNNWLQQELQKRGCKIEQVEKYWENAASLST